MKGLRSIPKILKINEVDGYQVSCLFNNGESRVIDFKAFFRDLKGLTEQHPAFRLLRNRKAFQQIEIMGHTLGWRNMGISTRNFDGEEVFYPYEMDPVVLFGHSVPDETRSIQVGLMIKQARKAAGMTQQELAQKSGTSKHYISRLENNRSDIELLTLKKIIEAGLGKQLTIRIQ